VTEDVPSDACRATIVPEIVAAVATSLFDAGARDIVEAQQFDDLYAKRFFMRVAFSGR